MNECLNCQASLPTGAANCPACGADVPLWIARGGQTFGPYTLAALQQSQVEGRLGAEDQIMVGSEGVWRPLAAVLPAIPVRFAGSTVPPPPPPPPAVAGAMAQRKAQDNRQVLVVALIVGGLLMFLILPILAAIMFPVFARAREKARQSSCMANVKQLSLAMLQYAQDYDERFPPRPLSQTPQRLEDGRVASGHWEQVSGHWPPRDWRRDVYPYCKNAQIYLCPAIDPPNALSYQCNPAVYGLRLADVPEPQRLIQLYDFGLLDGTAQGPHNQGYNAGFVDGHCKWVRDKQGYLTAPGPR